MSISPSGKTIFSEYRDTELNFMKTLQPKLKTILAGSNIEYRNCMLKKDGDEIKFTSLKLEYQKFLEKYQSINGNQISTLFLGMGPSWNVDNAIPFDYLERNEKGNSNVRKWLGVEGQAASSDIELKKPFWSLMQFACASSDNFYQRCVVRNYCPFAFGKDGKDGKVDVSLAKLPTAAGNEIKQICREALVDFIDMLSKGRNKKKPLQIFILGDYDTQGIEKALKKCIIVPRTEKILHPAVPGIPPAVWKMEATWKLLEQRAFISLFLESRFIKFFHDHRLLIDGALRKKNDRSDEQLFEYYTNNYTMIFGAFIEAQRQKEQNATVGLVKKMANIGI